MVWLIRIAITVAVLLVLFILYSLSQANFARMGWGVLGLVASYVIYLAPLWLPRLVDMQISTIFKFLTLRIRGTLSEEIEIRECKERHIIESYTIGVTNLHPVSFWLEIVNKTGLTLSMVKLVYAIKYESIPIQVAIWEKNGKIASNGTQIEPLIVKGKENKYTTLQFNPFLSPYWVPPSNENWSILGTITFNTIYGNISKKFSFDYVKIGSIERWGEVRSEVEGYINKTLEK